MMPCLKISSSLRSVIPTKRTDLDLLLDTHILIDTIDRRRQLPGEIQNLLEHQSTVPTVSAATLWEIAIKSRLGKLPLPGALDDLPVLLDQLGFAILPIKVEHVLHEAMPRPRTKDPFDRLLLAQCDVENMHLLTLDRALLDHPLAWRAA